MNWQIQVPIPEYPFSLSRSDRVFTLGSCFAQHMAAALNLKSTVCWSNTKPEIFGYKLHDNIKSNPFTKEMDYGEASYAPFNLSENIHNFPYNELNEVFDSNKIFQSLEK